jgi:hypothetical protein
MFAKCHGKGDQPNECSPNVVIQREQSSPFSKGVESWLLQGSVCATSKLGRCCCVRGDMSAAAAAAAGCGIAAR